MHGGNDFQGSQMSIFKHPWSTHTWEWLWWGGDFSCLQREGTAWAHTECLWSVFQTKARKHLWWGLDPPLTPAFTQTKVLLTLRAVLQDRGCREVTSIPIRAAKLTEYLLHIPFNYTKACKKKSLISLTCTASVAGTTSCFSLKLSKILLILAGWLKWATVCFSSSSIDNGRLLWTTSNLLWNHRVFTGNFK